MFEADLREGHFGRIWLNTDPMRIEINRRVAPVRATISLIHELLHMGEKLLKMPLNHLLLHRVAVYLYSRARDLFHCQSRGRAPSDVRRLVADAFEAAGIDIDDNELAAWTNYVETEVAPTTREFTRRIHGFDRDRQARVAREA